MTIPRFVSPRRLPRTDVRELEALIGRRYHAVAAGTPNDGTIGLIATDEGGHTYLDVLSEKIEIQRIEQGGVYSLFQEQVTTPISKRLRHINGHPLFRSLIERYDLPQNDALELIHGRVSPRTRSYREQVLRNILSAVTPEMRRHFNIVDFRSRRGRNWQRGYADNQLGGLRMFVWDLCGRIVYHEMTHFLTSYHKLVNPSFLKVWKKTAGNEYAHRYLPHQEATPQDLRDAFIEHYARSNPEEDISELTCYISLDPRYVKERMVHSPLLFQQKIELLFQYGYIREDHYRYLLSDGPLPQTAVPACKGETQFHTFWDAARILPAFELPSTSHLDYLQSEEKTIWDITTIGNIM